MDILKLEEYDHIFYVEPFLGELQELLSGFGQRKKFEKWFTSILVAIDTLPLNTVIQRSNKKIEHIDKKMHSIRYKGREKNIRILFIADGMNINILECAFIEKGDNDYNLNIRKAWKRYREAKV